MNECFFGVVEWLFYLSVAVLAIDAIVSRYGRRF